MRRNSLFLVLLLASFLLSCGGGSLIEKYEKIENNKWAFEDIKEFEINVTDTTKQYEVWAMVKHGNDYPYSNLWMSLYKETPSGEKAKQRFELRLAEPNGKWLGQGIGGNITQERRLLKHFTFSESGTYKLSLQHDMRLNQVGAIKRVGLKVVEIK